VILVDANLLIYACAPKLPQHRAARLWLDAKLAGADPVGLPWESLLAFVRVVTSPRVFRVAVGIDQAWGRVESWLDLPCVWIPEPTERHRFALRELLGDPGIVGPLMRDAHLAALAIEHGLTLCSSDGDFARFRGLRWENPLRPR
jgi:toxin-antitoxin system PIN domain toxin